MSGKALGKHILIEFYGCSPEVLNDVASIERAMIKAAKEARATIINTNFHRFSPHGISGVVIIQESHLTIHTWPEHAYASVDIFTCGETVDPWAAYHSLKSSLHATTDEVMEIDRGNSELTTLNQRGQFQYKTYTNAMSAIEKRLAELGITIPTPAKPLAAYTPAVQHGNLVFTAGQLPLVDGKLIEPGGKGKVNSSRKDEVKNAARVAAINTLAAVRMVIGDLDKIGQIVKVTVFVASASDFVEQPFVANGASELYMEIFGDAGVHARSAVGVAELPLDASVEVELVVGLK